MPKVAYLGSSISQRALLSHAMERCSFELSKFKLADEGLAALVRDKFDLIIMHDEIAPGNLNLPNRPLLEDLNYYSNVTCEVIRQTRQVGPNRQTCIIVPYTEDCEITPLRGYLNAGATECIDIFLGDSLNIFSDAVFRNIGRVHR